MELHFTRALFAEIEVHKIEMDKQGETDYQKDYWGVEVAMGLERIIASFVAVRFIVCQGFVPGFVSTHVTRENVFGMEQ